ncbi:unnamed protein product [Ascophyllum nodosum]
MSIESLKAVAKASWVWLVRRGFVLGGCLLFSLGIPMKMWKSFADRRDGVGFFADPLGKPSLSTYWRTLAELSYSLVFLLSKRPTGEGFSAADNSPTVAWGDDGIKVRDRGSYLEFIPSEGEHACEAMTADARSGSRWHRGSVIILPGGLVSPLAYAPLARTMAQKGYSSFVVRFDFDLAFYGWDRVGDIMARRAEPEGENSPASPTKWILVGHSIGTIAIEKFYSANSERVDGVVYMGSGNTIGEAMTGVDVPALLLWGTRDPLCPAEAMEKSAHKLPKDTEKVVVEGGNHRGFASYDWQPFDWEATISQQEQRRIVVEALCDFIERKVTIAT